MSNNGMMFNVENVSMKYCLSLVICIGMFFVGNANCVYAGFDDVLKEVLMETSQTSRPVGSTEYTFSPGDEVIRKQGYTVNYSGYERDQAGAVLLFTVFELDKSYLLKFPSPDVIQIKDVKLKIVSFDNLSLRIQLVREPARRYSN